MIATGRISPCPNLGAKCRFLVADVSPNPTAALGRLVVAMIRLGGVSFRKINFLKWAKIFNNGFRKVVLQTTLQFTILQYQGWR